MKTKILELHRERYSLIENLQQMGDNDLHEDELNDKIDKLGEEILSLLTNHSDELEFEFIMEQLSMLGQAPNLLYDDNGHWAVTSEGWQNVVADEPEDVETHFYVEAHLWKDTPREALKVYFEE